MHNQLDAHFIQQLKHEIQKHALPTQFLDSILQRLLPIAESINNHKLNKNNPIIISFNGAQGSGKSTLTHFIALILTHHFKQNSINVSLDDFYLSQQQRLELAKTIHPLLKTRGVPGTHDLKLAVSTLQKVTQCSSQAPCLIPQFNKVLDNPYDKARWIKLEKPVDIVLFEGWCNHAPIQNLDELSVPINALEKQEDPNGVWRHYVNEQLKIYHKQLFSLCDLLYFIKIPNFNKVLEWRSLQEAKLTASQSLATMDHAELIYFIQHFERLTQSSLKSLSKSADSIIELDDQHRIKNIINSQHKH